MNKGRNVERPTPFSIEIEKYCNICDIQGVCKNENEYTLMFEAVEMQNNNLKDYKKLLPDDIVYIKSCFAELVNCHFAIFLHKKNDDKNTIWVGIFKPNHENHTPLLIKYYKFNEKDFITWWKEIKEGRQTKFYRPNMKKAIEKSYFDQLLENHGSSWGTNLDGFVYDKDPSGNIKIVALVENRFSTKDSIYSYDPSLYYHPSKFNYGDHKTWNSLFELKKILKIPLFLFTYSRASGMENKIGLSEVIHVDESTGIIYQDNMSPNKNVKTSKEDVAEWIKLKTFKN